MKMWMLSAICLVGLNLVSASAMGETPTVATGDHGTQGAPKAPQNGTYTAPQTAVEDKNARLEQFINACLVKRPGNDGIDNASRRITR